MKLAIASCFNPINYPNQPVWDHVKAHSPDTLVLLGDSIYLDIPWVTAFGETVHPSDAAAVDFLQHGLKLYRTQLNETHFAQLIGSVPKTFAIWDDHDFLWNEHTEEAAITKKVYAENIRITRALFNAFCRTLDARLAPGSFPADYNDAIINQANEPAPGYKSRRLANDLVLHLTDGRSWRLGKDMLGADQRSKMAAKMAQAPDAVHLVASGSVLRNDCDAQWRDFDDFAWLQGLARQYKVLVLSGDIHSNRMQSMDLGGGRWLHDATSSGAAIRQLVGTGSKCENYGLLAVSPQALRLDFFSHGTPDSVGSWSIDRNTWVRTSVE